MENPVSNYYDQNTRRFLRCAAAGAGATIHRAVWGDDVTNREQAVNYVHELLLRYLPATSTGETPVIWDLGCGVGASIVYLADRRAGRYRGLTVSSVQQRLAAERIAAQANMPASGRSALQGGARGSGRNAEVLVGDFCDGDAITRLRTDGDPDLVYLIEAFAHASDPRALIDAVARSLRPGGRLCICDDLPVRPENREQPLLRRFMSGWRLPSLWSSAEIRECAAAAGLSCIADIDLTRWTETGRLRDRFIRTVVTLADWSRFSRSGIARRPFWGNMLGGDALQQATRRGLLEYRFLVLERR